jgi:hypothetical protein
MATDRRATLPETGARDHWPEPLVRDLPPLPKNKMAIIGPGIVAAGVGLSSGEFVLWPFISANVGLVFLWAAIVGVVTQFFLNMEIERYTLATGETAITGFTRLWRHWGVVLAIMAYFANLWPGWALSSATLGSYLFGGSPQVIAVVMLLVIGVSLTLAPVVYVALERMIFVKVAAVMTLAVLAAVFAIDASSWRELPAGLVNLGYFPGELGFPLLFGAMVFAGAGGGQNLCQSNWIRDKGFGMGKYAPRLVSPVTGVEHAVEARVSYRFETTPANMDRWRQWWRFANVEQWTSFVLVTVFTIALTSLLAHSTLFGRAGLPNGVAFLDIESQELSSRVGTWFGVLFLATGAFSLFGSAMGIIDYTSRLAADILKSTYVKAAGVSESRLYFGLVWGLVAIGVTILLSGMSQPLVLLIISASTGGLMMFVYSGLLIILNRRRLPHPIRTRSFRLASLVWATVLFGAMAAVTTWQQLAPLIR